MTTDEALARILDACRWPDTDGEAPLSHAKIMSAADRVIAGDLWPEIIASHGDYGINKVDRAITADLTRYRLPENAYGPIRTVTLVTDDDPDTEWDVVAVNLSDVGRLSELPPSPSGFYHYIDGDYCVLFPKPSETANTLRIRYYRHPLKLCKLIDACRCVRLFYTPTVINVEALDATSATAVPASWVDLDVIVMIRDGNAHQVTFEGAEISIDVGLDALTMTSVNQTAVEASDATADDLYIGVTHGPIYVRGDYIAVNGTTPVVQVPDHMLPMFVNKAAEECLRSFGDRPGAAEQRDRGIKLEKLAKQASIPRSQADSGILRSRNSPLRAQRGGFGWNRW